MHSRTITFAREAFVLIHPSCFLFNISTAMSKKVSSSSSFEKMMESPFSLKDMCSSTHVVHGVCNSKRLNVKSSVKVKVLSSSTTGKKLKRRKRSNHRQHPPSTTTTTLSNKSSVSSVSVPNHVRVTSSSLAKIDSPDLAKSSRIKNGRPRLILQAFKQTRSSPSPSTSSTTFGKSNKILFPPPMSVKSHNTTTSSVKLSRNYSSLISTDKHSPSTSSSSSSSRSISRNPFYLRRPVISTNGYNHFGIHDLARGLKMSKFKNIVVMSGAGISTASGIPDFRTPGTGLYDNLQQYKIPEPSAIFDITFFVRNPRPFFTLAKELYPGKYPPNVAHHFIRLLQDKDLLLRHYTQNIDGLERIAGIRSGKLVESHGSFATASCTVCLSIHDPTVTKELIFQNKIPYCKHKLCKGIVKPDIVFFGEDLPNRFYALRYTDLSQCDLLIIMGTSLEVEPFASLVTLTKHDVPRVLVNREIVGPFKQQRKRSHDMTLTGDMCDRITEIVKLAGWTDRLNDLTTSDRTIEMISPDNKTVMAFTDSKETVIVDQSSANNATPTISNEYDRTRKCNSYRTRANSINSRTNPIDNDKQTTSSSSTMSSSSVSDSNSSSSDTSSDYNDIIVRDISELSLTDKKR